MGDKLYLSYETQPKLSNNFRADEKFFVGLEKSHKFGVLQKVSLAKVVRLNLNYLSLAGRYFTIIFNDY